ncbi:major facilitator superfamily domain-containing protein [Tricharina praecox]|uniref:major facilitator superfamily domain-containing protein n=1 Tax=Tricharina praecox TaxID=43433 RepID=UPI00221F4D8F|nr:major facilitator superfamily domain-containing protein [Tricharina praecox]KAI5852371.1 major facilitator superfamily domain-containing protein [Tricharina praecox]
MPDPRIESWMDFSDSGATTPISPTSGTSTPRFPPRAYKPPKGLGRDDLERASEKLRSHNDTPLSNLSTTNLNDQATEMSQIPEMAMARAAGLSCTLMAAAFLNTLSVQAMVIAMPSIGEAFDMPKSRQQWIITSYALTFGCFLLLWGKIGDIYGKRLVFLIGGVWVAVTTLATAFAPSEIVFDILRALSGLGAAANVPAAMGILGTSIPPGKVKSYAFAIYSAGAPLGAVCGTLVGGILTEYASWQWIFYLVAIVSAVVTAAAYFVIPVPKKSHSVTPVERPMLDYFGAFLITLSLVLLIFTLSQGNTGDDGWTKPYIPSLLLVFVILFMTFVAWEWWLENKTKLEPLMRMSIWSNRGFTVSMVVTGFFWAAFNNYMVYATFFYQDFLGLSPIATTLRFLPTGVAGALITIVSGYLLSRVSGQHILIVGVICTAISCMLMAAPIPPETTYWAWGFPAMILAVVGADTVYPCLSLYTTGSMPMKDQALAGGIFNTVGQIGRAVGLALATAVDVGIKKNGGNRLGDLVPGMQRFDDHHDDKWAILAALRTAQWLNTGMALIALVAVIAGLRNIGKVGAAKPNGDKEER